MKINLLILGIILTLTAGITYWIQDRQADHVTNIYDIAPDFDYTTLAGNRGQLIDHKDKVVLVHFWATWCPPCIIEFPNLIKLTADQSDNFIVLAISVDEKTADIQKFMNKQNKPLPKNFIVIQDTKQKIAEDLFGIKKYPANFLLSPSLEIREILKGPEENWHSDKWRRKIQKLMK